MSFSFFLPTKASRIEKIVDFYVFFKDGKGTLKEFSQSRIIDFAFIDNLGEGWGEGLKAALKSDIEATPELRELLRGKSDAEKVRLVEAWKKMNQLGADEALRRNPAALDALSKTKGSRPDPSEYLSQKYIDDHLKKFEGGGSRVVSKADFEDFGVGKPDAGRTEFISTKSEVDEILKLPIAQQADRLGIPIEQLKNGEVVRIDFKPSNKIEMPSGNEWGANEKWDTWWQNFRWG